MVISFDGNPVAFTLEDEENSGQLSKRVWADLTSFVGQTGELRIGIEGPHTFRIWHERPGYLNREYPIAVTGGKPQDLGKISFTAAQFEEK